MAAKRVKMCFMCRLAIFDVRTMSDLQQFIRRAIGGKRSSSPTPAVPIGITHSSLGSRAGLAAVVEVLVNANPRRGGEHGPGATGTLQRIVIPGRLATMASAMLANAFDDTSFESSKNGHLVRLRF